MPFERSSIAPEAQAYYIKIGRRFGSDDTLRQADKTLLTLDKHIVPLAVHGVGEQHRTLLRDLRDALLAAGVDRNQTRTDKKVTNAALLDAMHAGKAARFQAHGALSGARLVLFNGDAKAAVNDIDAALDATRSAGADADALAKQLELLSVLVAKAPIAEAIGEPASALGATLAARIDALKVGREATATPRGTPAQTELLDLIDGMIVEITRAARKAGRALSGVSGQPSIANELQLTELYRTRGRPPSEDQPIPVG
jgi:hypothetical protein